MTYHSSAQPDKGSLQIQVTQSDVPIPIENAKISISDTGLPEDTLEQLSTDNSGLTDTIFLNTPPFEYTQTPTDNQPYSEYNLKIEAEGYETAFIGAVQMYSNTYGRQTITLEKKSSDEIPYNPNIIGPHTLWGNYPPKIAESEIKPINETGEIVLSKVVVPEFIIVHDGAPTDSTAAEYYVPYADYIKNVACCEIYDTWPDETLRANILAIISFTLNRVYTEWYRNKGYSFTITSSTAYDHKWIKDKTIYESISGIVDEIFANYLSRPNVEQPILTQYCDGKRVTCPKWMSQWGSKYLGDDGFSAIEILRNYYGDTIYINEASAISGIPSSWPGEDLTIGSSGPKVKILQEQLNRIAKNYPAIPTITADGIYGQKTASAVKAFQKIFKLPQTGIVNYSTWYRISEIYVAVSKIAEL